MCIFLAVVRVSLVGDNKLYENFEEQVESIFIVTNDSLVKNSAMHLESL